ncbi:hypothetical protein PCE1_004253 [Barthelona sp. PCE]
MLLTIGDITVLFPYEYVYPEQLAYIRDLVLQLNNTGVFVLEMPCGTGKTVALLSALLSFKMQKPTVLSTIIYCTRTIAEMEQVATEIETWVEAALQIDQFRDFAVNLLATSLSSRRTLCCHDDISIESYENYLKMNEIESSRLSMLDYYNAECRRLTRPFFGEAIDIEDLADIPHCPHYDPEQTSETVPHNGVWSLKRLFKSGTCPYWMTRHMLPEADIIVLSYLYMLDPMIYRSVMGFLQRDSILVFDECHNLPEMCTQSYSSTVTKEDINQAKKCIENLQVSVFRNQVGLQRQKFEKEYKRVLEVEAIKLCLPDEVIQDILQNAYLPEQAMTKLVPGSMRRTSHFLRLLFRASAALQQEIDRQDERVMDLESLTVFLERCRRSMNVQSIDDLLYISMRLNLLFESLGVTDMRMYFPLIKLAHFFTILITLAQGTSGNARLAHQKDRNTPHIISSIRIECFDASIVFSSLRESFDRLVLTSATLSPPSYFCGLLGMTPESAFVKSYPLLSNAKNFRVVNVSAVNDLGLTTAFKHQDDENLPYRYYSLLFDICSVVPDGAICFFPSYRYMFNCFNIWSIGYEKEVMQLNSLSTKLLFFEPKSPSECDQTVTAYKTACDSGRGGLLCCIARGKVSEGVDFENHYGRISYMLGVPYKNVDDPLVVAKFEYQANKISRLLSTMGTEVSLQWTDLLNYDAMACVAQCMGRIIRSRKDYGMMVLADRRFIRLRKLLPEWVLQRFPADHCSLMTSNVMSVARQFFRANSQALSQEELNKTQLNEEAAQHAVNTMKD